ncbi:MAG: VWA domain-containing protein [Treponema sp.]|jgi:hypothetical protein|nr:VWA domain-containing protein [Treponema sp.]
MPYKHFVLGSILLILFAGRILGQELSINAEDLRIEQRVDGGFHLFIRKKPNVSSVLLTESTKDPAMQEDNYAYRSAQWNAVNGDEIRIIDGSPIPPANLVWSLIDSTAETHPELGQAFHIYIPYILYYGYENTRHGEIYIVDGTYLNIRSFALPYGDYRGAFKDNPFVLRVTQKPLEGPPEGNYMKDTVEAFTEIASSGRGDLVYSTGPNDLVRKIRAVLDKEKGKTLDLVICLDTTSSMQDDINSVRRALIPMLRELIGSFASFRIGMVLYKDYFDEYLNQVVPFTADFEVFQRTLNAIRVNGGRDIPEAVYEALYEAALKFPWEAESKLVVLIGDAPPHPRQRGDISKEMADEAVARRDIKVHAIILPQ